MGAVEVTIPGGMAIEGQWYRRAWLNAVTGHDEEFLMGPGRFLCAAARATQLLSRCVHRLGPMEPVGPETVRQLRVGDRESLLLQLRRLTVGDRLPCVLHCPSCEKKMDLDLSIGELLLPPYRYEQTFYQTTVDTGDASYQVVFRPPNGEDQEAASMLAADSLAAATELVLRRCIARTTGSSGEECATVPDAVLLHVADRIAEVDPQAEVLIDVACPECATAFVVPFDITDCLCRELAGQEREFYRGVHALSFHYHWEEDAILKLGRRKRQLYQELLADETAGWSGNR